MLFSVVFVDLAIKLNILVTNTGTVCDSGTSETEGLAPRRDLDPHPANVGRVGNEMDRSFVQSKESFLALLAEDTGKHSYRSSVFTFIKTKLLYYI